MKIRVIRPGMLTLIQDLGRYGMQKDGVIVSGAMDSFALRAANFLVGNKENEAALEITLLGPKLEFLQDSLIAICGGDLSPSIDGQFIPQWRAVFVKKGSLLSFGESKSGCRAYLTVAGGFEVPEIMGSRSTYLRAGIGGFHGRSLMKDDILEVRNPSETAVRRIKDLSSKTGVKKFAASKWSISTAIFPPYKQNPTIRVIPGGQFNWFSNQSKRDYFDEEFQVLLESDRMGYRLSGPSLQLSAPKELISEAVTAGTVQVPSDGCPIILLADRQTTGGYPKIAQVATVDLPILAQVKPGEKVRFRKIELEEAQTLLRQRETGLLVLKQSINLKV